MHAAPAPKLAEAVTTGTPGAVMQQLPATTGAAGPQVRDDRNKMQATQAAAGHHTHTRTEVLGMQNPAARAEAAVLDSIPQAIRPKHSRAQASACEGETKIMRASGAVDGTVSDAGPLPCSDTLEGLHLGSARTLRMHLVQAETDT